MMNQMGVCRKMVFRRRGVATVNELANRDTAEGVTGGGATDGFAAKLRGFGPVGVAAIILVLAGNIVIPPLGALLALLWAWRARVPWADIGFAPPRGGLAAIAGAAAVGVLLKLGLKALLLPLLGAPAINPNYHFLAGNPAALPGMIGTVIVVAGFGEE